MRIHHSLALTALLLSGTAVVHAQQSQAQQSQAQQAHQGHGAPAPIVKPIMTKALPDYPDKEGLILTVDYPPGGSSPIHHHDAHAFVYVIEGSVVMAVQGGKEVTLSAGQSWSEAPGDVHTVSRNASNDKPAKFVVFMLKDAGKPAVIPGT